MLNILNNIFTQIVVNLVLFFIYLFVFGQHSVKKYLDNAVIITETEERPPFISPPGKYC